MKYGPQTAQIETLLEQIKSLTPEQIEALSAAWGAAWGAARFAAWDAAWDAARDAALSAALSAAWNAAWGAVLALVVQDLISEEHFNILYGPWASVMG